MGIKYARWMEELEGWEMAGKVGKDNGYSENPNPG